MKPYLLYDITIGIGLSYHTASKYSREQEILSQLGRGLQAVNKDQ